MRIFRAYNGMQGNGPIHRLVMANTEKGARSRFRFLGGKWAETNVVIEPVLFDADGVEDRDRDLGWDETPKSNPTPLDEGKAFCANCMHWMHREGQVRLAKLMGWTPRGSLSNKGPASTWNYEDCGACVKHGELRFAGDNCDLYQQRQSAEEKEEAE